MLSNKKVAYTEFFVTLALPIARGPALCIEADESIGLDEFESQPVESL